MNHDLTTPDLRIHDKAQREQALIATQSFIVQAPAGSGKTELLIQRFLTLLTRVKTPEEILAITFTKKAASEMRLRVLKSLKQAQTEPEPESAHAKNTWHLAKKVLERDSQFNWQLITNPNQLRIQTIDALCAYLTKQLPLLSHFGSQPDIADNPQTLYREAVQEVLKHVETDYEWAEAIAKLLLHLDNDLNKLHDLLVNLLTKRDQWLSYVTLNTQDDSIKKQLELQLALVIKDSLNTVRKNFPTEYINEVIALARYAADNLAISDPTATIQTCRSLEYLPGTDPKDKSAWLALSQLLLTNEGEWRKLLNVKNGFPAPSSFKNPNEKKIATEYKQRIQELIGNLSTNENLRLILAELSYLPDATYTDNQWEILKALLHVLKIVAAQLRITFQQHGKIDFIENAQAALVALGNENNHTDLALALDYQIKHILVDEFQDTSFSQYQLLEKLTLGWQENDGRTLFVVGDPMQSIYRFRQAEVGLFIRMWSKGLGQIKLTPITLAMNFRSTNSIVEWNNAHFQSIFPVENDIATGAVTYSPSLANQIQVNERDIHIQGLIDADDDIQAQHILHIIETTREEHPNDNIAVLVRARTHLNALIPQLKKAKIRYRAVDIDPLAGRQTIQDLLSLTRALLRPSDRIAWLALLRAPWCGLTLADLLVIAGDNAHASIWEQLNRYEVIEKLSSDGKVRLQKILPILKSTLAERDRFDLRSWIENTWLLLGGPACLQDQTELDDANDFFELLSEYNQQYETLNLDKLVEKIDKMRASTQHDDAVLQIMTIHSAKGLEFDTVIIPHLQKTSPHDDNELLLWMERPLVNDQTALLLGPIHATGNNNDTIYEYIRRQQRIRADYEMDRLFYVATTRAKKRLHLLFNLKNENGELSTPSGNSFLTKLWPFIANKKEEIFSAPLLSHVNKEVTEKIKLISRLNLNWKNPITEKTFSTFSFHQQQSGFSLEENKFKLIGTISHKILQQMSQFGAAWWSNQSKHNHQAYILNLFKQYGLLQKYHEQASLTILTIIQNTLQDERGQWILHAHKEAQSELALTVTLNNKIENIVIDRTFIDEEGTRWIIDYKTSALTHDDLENFLHKEREKYLQQMQKYYHAMKLMDDRPIRMGLYFPALPAWQEWD